MEQTRAARRVIAALRGREPRCGQVQVIAIDGGAAAGKSTLAAQVAALLQDDHQVAQLHTDDLLDGWEGQLRYWDRLRGQVLEPLARGQLARYHRYDWNLSAFTDEVALKPPQILIVEGVAAIEACAEHAALRVYLELPRSERERRWAARDGLSPGVPLEPEWLRWLEREEAYFAEHPPQADIVITAGESS